MLGIDVHDCAAAREETYRNGPLGAGYVLTVEPGLYFQPNDLSVLRNGAASASGSRTTSWSPTGLR